ncbi:malonate decarboxylase holo-ACP synthase [Bacillus sp. ISL-40]|uniref:malonate decarboxylase holo-ACP synthase n=1 Tax=unclassified Bacillus (in: firmicutes) TaxID=185979 RepID=UPI001BE952FD|nr:MULTISPECIES: malonate decarboxylase holo-ACP synthase [unclassified Bacillus (in: firmicutes)]MBT2698424.1 malonate decarboxylase holo-ACP synthase [Bacillus sp. ISL-40]MBT2722121.1 malonate decarboxylase holo-ACP synthase [Bacillus sp. ISL-46]MBT2740590.1 malonate decarboxylase holo-ACP synthase [Bacillus sp. ISL-77]
MVLEPHDLLEINRRDLISHSPIPDWAVLSLEIAPFVVVRRAIAPNGQVAVGIRGRNRNERFAAFLPKNRVIQQIKPEHLTEYYLWENKQAPVFSALTNSASLFIENSLTWGPGGSVGFELASSVEAVTLESDLDIIIRAPEPLPMDVGVQIVQDLKKSPVRIDVQVEAPKGSFSLSEYVRGSELVLLKTFSGPRMSKNPWNDPK